MGKAVVINIVCRGRPHRSDAQEFDENLSGSYIKIGSRAPYVADRRKSDVVLGSLMSQTITAGSRNDIVIGRSHNDRLLTDKLSDI